jgi:hypothetical protein
MDFEHIFAGGMILGFLASIWQYLKMVFWRLINLLIIRNRVEGYVGTAISYYCWLYLKRSPFGERTYGGNDIFVQPMNRNQVVGFEEPGADFIVFWDGWKPLIIYRKYESSKGVGPGESLMIIFIRGTFDSDGLVIKALDGFNERRHSGEKGQHRYRIERHFGQLYMMRKGVGSNKDSEEIGNPSTARIRKEEVAIDRRWLQWRIDQLGSSPGEVDPFSVLALPQNALDLIEKVRQWVESESWYREKMIPWRLGLLMWGKPGTGKSSVARALGQRFDLPINVFDLSSFGNEDFAREWSSVLSTTPCILLIEDIDAVFDGRVNRGGEGALTFDCLLNCLSGVKEANGVLLIITTNHPECLDEALGKPDVERNQISTRPGRIDYVLELGPLDGECRRRIAKRILADCQQHLERLVSEGDGDTGAQFQNRCEGIALSEYWKDKK